ncbi:MAG: hypothetical protein FWC40_03485 [Proteobacteria bacterium]|nr:hypothetical protein [Pseudomonadota bacterium]
MAWVKKTLLPVIFAIFTCLPFISLARAEPGESYFYADEGLIIALPKGIETHSCDEELALKAGRGCMRLGQNGQDGVVFFRLDGGYYLDTPAQMNAHLEASANALRDIPNVHVMQTRILSPSPLVGLIDIIRRDEAVSAITALQSGNIRQTSFLIPTGDRLAQIFLYVSLDDASAVALYDTFLANFVSGIQVMAEPVSDPHQPQAAQSSSRALSVLSTAAILGGAIALTVILVLWWSARLRAARRRRDEETSEDLGDSQSPQESPPPWEKEGYVPPDGRVPLGGCVPQNPSPPGEECE